MLSRTVAVARSANRIPKRISRPLLFVWFVWFVLFIWFIWLVSFNPKTKQTRLTRSNGNGLQHCCHDSILLARGEVWKQGKRQYL